MNNICPIEEFEPTSDFELPKQNCLPFEPTRSTCLSTMGKKTHPIKVRNLCHNKCCDICLIVYEIKQQLNKMCPIEEFEPTSDFELPKWNCLTFTI